MQRKDFTQEEEVFLEAEEGDDLESAQESDPEDEEDLEVWQLFRTSPAAGSPPQERASERPRRPALRRSHRSASTGGSPLVGGLPYTGRPFCEYNCFYYT